MTAVKFTVWRGTNPTLRFTLNPVVSGGIAGWTTQFSVRRSAVDPDPLVLAVIGTVEDATLCIVDVALTEAQTLALSAGTYDVSLMRTDLGAKDILAEGPMTVKNSVLNPAY